MLSTLRSLVASKQAVPSLLGVVFVLGSSIAALDRRWALAAVLGSGVVILVVLSIWDIHRRIGVMMHIVRQSSAELQQLAYRESRDDIETKNTRVSAEAVMELMGPMGDVAAGGPLSRIEEALSKHEQLVRRVHHETITEIDALLQLHRRLSFDGPAPLVAGAAMFPRGLLEVVDIALMPNVELVVECGSGTSTVYLAKAIALRHGTERIVCVEHDWEYAERTRSQLDQLGLGEYAEVRLAELEDVSLGGESYLWYDHTVLADIHGIDLLVVDGPPGTTGEKARYPAFPLLRDRLSDSAFVFLDDCDRLQERQIARSWLQDPYLERVRGRGRNHAVMRFQRPPMTDQGRL